MYLDNQVRETYDEAKVKHKGYCVLVINCDKDSVNFGTGIVVARNKDLATLTRETMRLVEDRNVGIFRYSTFTGFEDYYSPIQVIEHE